MSDNNVRGAIVALLDEQIDKYGSINRLDLHDELIAAQKKVEKASRKLEAYDAHRQYLLGLKEKVVSEDVWKKPS